MAVSRGATTMLELRLLCVLTVSVLVSGLHPLGEATNTLQCPLEELVPTTTGVCQDMTQCKKRYTLEEPIYYNFARYNCRCDADCRLYGDCCSDTDHNKQNDADKPAEGTMSCVNVPVENSFGLSIYLVNKCPATFRGNQSIQRRCEQGDKDDILNQWIVSDDNGLVYANVYCALCHGIEDPIFWQLKNLCSNDIAKDYKRDRSNGTYLDLLDMVVNDSSCESVYSHPSLKFGGRYCKPMISSCSPDWPQQDCVKEQCELNKESVAQVFDLKAVNIYKNPYCAICNNITDYTCRDFITSEVLLMYATQQNARGFLPISVLFDLNSGYITGIRKLENSRDDSSEIFQGEVKSCPNKQVYNPSKGVCVDIVCGPGYTYTSGFCTVTTVNDDNLDSISQIGFGCTYIILAPSEFSVNISTNNSTMLYSKEPASQTYLNSGFIVLENGSALVCTNYSRNFTIRVGSRTTEAVSFEFDKSQALLSLVGQMLSIVALSFQLFVYAILPPLRNLAGKNLMCLSASLLVAQITFLVGISRTEVYGLCVFMAILIHYSYLASFFWMNIMSFDIWRTFSSHSRAHADSNQLRHFRRYSVYGWGSPLVFVVIAIIINFSLDAGNPNRPAYGEYICWITKRNALLVFFGMPIALITIANTIFYAFTVYNIYKVQASTRIATTSNKQSNKCQFLLYIKLCAIMGLTWIFAFIAMLGKIPVLWYVFIVLNSFQGVFICLTFVLTAKVLRLLSEKLRKLCSGSFYHMVSHDEDDKSRSTKTSKFSLSHTLSHDPNRRVSHDQVLLQQLSHDLNNQSRT